MAKIEIKSDCLDISQRIKSIDDGYFILFDTKRQKFEVHSFNQLFTTYCFTSPFNFLDERLLCYTLKTRKENKDYLIKEMDKENEKFIKNEKNKQKEKIFEQLENMGEI